VKRADRAAIERYTTTHRALFANTIEEYTAGIDHETPEFLALNRAAYEAEACLPRWRRYLIDRRLCRELDYWNRMRGAS
jgi:hypothetical protein